MCCRARITRSSRTKSGMNWHSVWKTWVMIPGRSVSGWLKWRGFFGIQTWFMKNVGELSGGQKQLLNLAAVMAMQPDILVLDEPTSQLDPLAAGDFFATLRKINAELGTSIVLIEHPAGRGAFPTREPGDGDGGTERFWRWRRQGIWRNRFAGNDMFQAMAGPHADL